MKAMWVAGVMGLLSLTPVGAAEPRESCGDFGTKIDFFDTPQEAAKWAKKEQKLVFVLHVSGIFEDPGLT